MKHLATGIAEEEVGTSLPLPLLQYLHRPTLGHHCLIHLDYPLHTLTTVLPPSFTLGLQHLSILSDIMVSVPLLRLQSDLSLPPV